ncbi:DUF2971 domain-containing protein [Ruegeria litorea]|uniref:DUF2971 domain-containing protein n=1 Tax=Falsiruegeria litorea TaxID=1280831 RepID=A0ABS5WK21_9RHOB|nr:DUF2971 domain-containing protein [Falsiruegeria litorea]MBT3139476.1 DUF2971 domain-containing protein [Falsiruegeria litorea]
MRLYYFTGPQHAVDNVARRQLKLSFPNEVNDIFEMMPFDFGDDKVARREWKRSIDKVSQSCGFISFSQHWGVPTMWGHYAQSHQGVCYGFDIEGDLLRMNYEKEFTDFFDEAFSGRLGVDWKLRFAQGTKSDHWEYEDESRLFLKLDQDERAQKARGVKVFYKEFGADLVLREIIIGAKSTLTKSDFEKALQGYDLCEKIIKARASFREFKIVEHKNFQWN